MPELPEVETIARELRALVLDATISGVWTDWPKVIRHPDPATFGREIVGRQIVDVGRRAKWLVVSLSGDAVLAIQVKMTGQLFVLPAGTSTIVTSTCGSICRRAMAAVPGRAEVRSRGLYHRSEAGTILGAEDAGELFSEHGPEPLADDFTLRAFRERVRKRRTRLKPLLLDQGFIAGVGNIYADEALWRARLHPLRSAASLRPDDERRLYWRSARSSTRRSTGAARRWTTTRRPRATARCRSSSTSTSAPARRALAAAGRCGGS